jgi:hypothetical protein|mmetsp:Transcript_113974/g.179409  ORF Transcript_113974/g.179409 Transcript_113974/m.179409 type:complete len:230 (-) Transcript_113974:421-1110(-)|eukprot:CAMPEP_0169101946 /NCGR_PEP_ID=MMETSP1015-20121227/21907_1 /TAXON_ID=342587 /ORGANISM="Karlodinium micrum, Strain CCMP2283" /LENGTH=229 /DNA_ID=CAMNT_0009163019 /DNA_START=30 /DNA_END=719 /DNA_ORIENTATION=-
MALMSPHAETNAIDWQEAWLCNHYEQCGSWFESRDESAQTTRSRKTKIQPYCPGQMLSENANSHTLTIPSYFARSASHDQEGQSDCSSTDTPSDAMAAKSSMPTTLTNAPSPIDIGTEMYSDTGMLSEMAWLDYSAPGWEVPPLYQASYWVPPAFAMPTQAYQTALSLGSAGHHKGICKPCAFVYKGGCESGAQCQYCHLCPPGEKQRRKRQVRFMQRNLGLGSSNLKE